MATGTIPKNLAADVDTLNSKTTTVTESLSLTSIENCTVTSCTAHVMGKICEIYLVVKITVNMTSGTEYTLGTLPSNRRPLNIAAIGSSGTTGIIISTGPVRIRPTISQSSGANLYLHSIYMIA